LKKEKTIRSANPNVGNRRKAQRHIHKVLWAFYLALLKDIREHTVKIPVLAEDQSLSNPRSADEYAREVKKVKKTILEIVKGLKKAERLALAAHIDSNKDFLSHLIDPSLRSVASWYVKTIAFDITKAQRRALIEAGFSPKLLRQKWTIPVGRQYIGHSAAAQFETMVGNTVSLIRNMTYREARFIQKAIQRSTIETEGYRWLERELGQVPSLADDPKRVETIVRDQTNKITYQISAANMKDAGITEAVWVHVPGRYTSRENHMGFNGKRFEIGKGLFDTEVMGYVQPGELINCRCTFRPILSKFTDDEESKR
jgi:SPP1 gp7 family putative phage head morphogenesis protein